MPDVISLERTARPDFSSRQLALADDLIGMGLARLAIASIVLGVSIESLTPTQVTTVNRMITKRYKLLGYRIVDARHARTEFVARAVQAAARKHRISVRIA